MASGFVSKDGAILASVQIVSDTHTDMEAAIKQLTSKVDQVIGSWDGQGATAFHRARARWSEVSTDLLKSLPEFAEALQRSEAGYQAADSSSSDSIQRLSALLG